jgi:hypothetical protein
MSNSFNKSPFSFNPPQKFNPSKFNNKDMLFNKKKISSDVLSMSSSSSVSSSSSSRSGTSNSSDQRMQQRKHSKPTYKKEYEEEDEEEVDEDDDNEEIEDNDDEEQSEQDSEDQTEQEDDDSNRYATMKKDKKQSMMSELNEKRELLYQMDRLESKGYKLPFKFNMETDINEMRTEYNKLIKEKEVDASIRFQRKMMMALVTGAEYLNTRYDPFSVKLDGWSEQVHENITDYDDIFEELHQKYKSTGKKMSPELRLFISLSGSAFMFHLTSRMFRENPLPNVEQVLKSNPDLMKQFQAAAAKQYIVGTPQQNNQAHGYGQQQPDMGGAGGIFGMVSNLFNNIGGGSSRQIGQPQQMRNTMDDDEISNSSLRIRSSAPRQGQRQQAPMHRDIDNIIKNVHNNISLDQYQDNIETLSVSDEEITSIIEDTADIKILRNGKKNKNTRTLNL